uniref:Rho GTPase-activating protein 7 isoform X2 n=2 Tax=Rhizophora mucronata TaxID=61149 RepID=A0A2P2MTI1_RHIMU
MDVMGEHSHSRLRHQKICMNGRQPLKMPLHKRRVLLLLWDIMEFLGVTQMMLWKDHSINGGINVQLSLWLLEDQFCLPLKILMEVHLSLRKLFDFLRIMELKLKVFYDNLRMSRRLTAEFKNMNKARLSLNQKRMLMLLVIVLSMS